MYYLFFLCIAYSKQIVGLITNWRVEWIKIQIQCKKRLFCQYEKQIKTDRISFIRLVQTKWFADEKLVCIYPQSVP